MNIRHRKASNLAAAAVLLMALIAYAMHTSGARGADPRAPAAIVDSLAASTSQSQAAVLSDGIVSDDEYVAAVNATVSCMRAQGVAVQDPAWVNGSLGFSFGSTATREGLAADKAIYQTCYVEHQRDIDVARAALKAGPLQSDDEFYGSRQACLEAGGMVYDGPKRTPGELIRPAVEAGRHDLLDRCW